MDRSPVLSAYSMLDSILNIHNITTRILTKLGCFLFRFSAAMYPYHDNTHAPPSSRPRIRNTLRFEPSGITASYPAIGAITGLLSMTSGALNAYCWPRYDPSPCGTPFQAGTRASQAAYDT